MAQKVVSVKLEAKVDGFVTNVKKAKASVDDLTKADIGKPAKAFDSLATKAAIGGAVLAIGVGKAIKSFADFDAQMSAASAALPDAGAKMEDLRQLAIVMGKDTQFSATEAATGITEMGKAGLDASQILGGGLKGALDLAAAGQLDVGQAGEIAATALNQFNLEGSQLPHVADLYAAAAGKAQGSVQDIAGAMKYAGVTASAMGISIEETTGVMGLFASKGIIGEQAGTGFRSMLLSLTSPSKIATKAMDTLGINVYDASGKFIGMQGAAQQLQDKLGPLDEATRNQALGQIFGNESMGAAIALYQAGGAGVADWTGKVNDAGFAAKQAAKLTDNLKGDMERLSGSIETVFIQAGSGANDALRTLAQGLGTVVDIIGKIPGPVLLAGGALGSLALLAPKGIIAYRNYAAQLDTLGLSLDKISTKSPRAAAGIKALGKASAVVTVAAVATALTDMAAAAQVGTPETEKLAASLVAVADGAQQAGAFSDLFARGVGPFRQEFATTADAMTEFGANARIALDPSVLEQYFGDASGASAIFTERVGQIDTALQGMVANGHAAQAAQLVKQLTDAAVAQGVPIDSLKGKFPGYEAAVKAAGDASAQTAPKMGELSQGAQDIQQSADDAKKALDDLRTAIEGFGSPLADQRAAQRDFQASIDGAAEGLAKQRDEIVKSRLETLKLTDPTKAQTKAAEKWADAQLKVTNRLDTNTDAGRANAANLDAIRSSTLKAATSTFALSGSMEETTAAVKKGRDAFIKAAIAAGMNAKQAGELADQLGLIPKDVATQIKMSGVPTANAQIDQVTGKVTILDKKTAKPAVKAQVDTGSLAYAEYKLDQLARRRTTTVAISLTGAGVTAWQQASRGKAMSITGKATGGPVYGPGTGTSDTAGLYALSNGEHVLTAAEVAAAGGQSAVFALRKAILSGGVQFRAAGGPVGRMVSGPGSSSSFDYARLASLMGGGRGGDTFIAQGVDATAAVQKVLRARDFREVGRL